MSAVLEIKDLHVSVEGKEILKGLSLRLESGKKYALMGPNGSGKSTLASVLMGHPKYEVTSGSISFNGEDVLEMAVDERAKKGLFLSFQYPKEVSGVTISNFLRTAVNEIRTARGEEKLSVLEFRDFLKYSMEKLSMNPEFANRYLNDGFSGGEKKRCEILQMLMLNPSLAILDETDSGLDIDALKAVSEGVNTFMNSNSGAENAKITLIITHYKRILEHVTPDVLFILIDGKIALTGDGSLVDELEEKGYGWIIEG